MVIKAIIVWYAFLVLAIGNNTFRARLISPLLGSQGAHVLCTVLLCILILATTWVTLPWIGPIAGPGAFALGGFWTALMLGSEYLMARVVFHYRWPYMLAPYNVVRGRIWFLVPITILLAPWLMSRI
jgi:hypothetical protein